MKLSSASILSLLLMASAVRGHQGAGKVRDLAEEESDDAYFGPGILTFEEATEAKTIRKVLVKYKTGHKFGCASTLTALNGNRTVGRPNTKIHFDFDEIDTMAIEGDTDVIDLLEKSAQVEYIEDDNLVWPMGRFEKYVDKRQLQETRPNGVNLVQAPAVWAEGYKGQGVKVCVVDSGIDYDHGEFITDNVDGVNTDHVWYQDNCGHGTHVSGTIAAEDDENGVVGVAPNAELFITRVFAGDWFGNCRPSSTSAILDAVSKCRDNGAKIISMSLGGGYPSVAAKNLYDSLADEGILVIAAAGNDGNTDKSYPASYNSVMSVGAVDSSSQHAGFSQRNNEVDIAAPGVSVVSTYKDGRFAYLSGTSMATPHVSGVAALLWSAFPDATATDIRSAIENTATDLGLQGRDDYYGKGLINAKKAYDYLDGSTTTTPAPVQTTPITPSPTPPTPSPTPEPTPADDSEGDILELRNSEEGTMCFELSNADTSNGNLIWLNTCNGTPEQQWRFGSDGYIRSSLDEDKCIVGSGGYTQKGTILMIYDCFENDSRFLISRYTDNSLRPKLALSQCVGPSKSRQSDEGKYFIQFWDCYGGPHQAWKWEEVAVADEPYETKEEETEASQSTDSPTVANDEAPRSTDNPTTTNDETPQDAPSEPELNTVRITPSLRSSSATKQYSVMLTAAFVTTLILFLIIK